jgi:hypothetical protein
LDVVCRRPYSEVAPLEARFESSSQFTVIHRFKITSGFVGVGLDALGGHDKVVEVLSAELRLDGACRLSVDVEAFPQELLDKQNGDRECVVEVLRAGAGCVSDLLQRISERHRNLLCTLDGEFTY